MDNKIELVVVGVTRKAVEANAYALLLKEKDGQRVLPVVVGTAEAQAIAVRLEGVMLPRPITHDLIVSMCHGFGIMPEYVELYDFVDGIFYAHLHMSSRDTAIDIDSRTSDAVAIALRTGAPIYTTSRLLNTAGYEVNNDGAPVRMGRDASLNELSKERLESLLQQAVDAEDYERAAEIQKIIASKMA
ncbi:MAG: bifunctional nuclease family protein [Muribaculaceae bacterium]|nr:bifunctional nuclease family protein [Muribaculaceae bacterium]